MDNAQEQTVNDINESKPLKLPYPKRIFLIIGNEFCERFNFYGMLTILPLFIKDKLGYTENGATILYHTFTMMVYSMCVFGAIISDTCTLTPILRADVHCFGENDCYSLAFGVPAILMIIAILMFVCGKSSYTYVEVSENMIIKMYKCIKHAISTRRCARETNPRKNLLDYSINRFGTQLVIDTRRMLNILVLLLPFPFFEALFMQTGSRWIFQAAKMNGDIGFYTIKPDQIGVLESFSWLILIPIFDGILYPILSKIGLGRPLQRIGLGGVLAGISFLLSAGLQFWIESSPKNSVNILWQVPQYVLLSMGQVMYSVTET
ncbi:peptide transporter family 1-like [Contarinia nasturtii]|uniref:peptide transporter family 1-like n=1 Tax=Contarinia nasturtii TaxID=265458 RepID=UPI0012D4B349|nr:peptide transporter family 1-like [Contarinia nasturtii]